jgi:hypothetical protein
LVALPDIVREELNILLVSDIVRTSAATSLSFQDQTAQVSVIAFLRRMNSGLLPSVGITKRCSSAIAVAPRTPLRFADVADRCLIWRERLRVGRFHAFQYVADETMTVIHFLDNGLDSELTERRA